MKRAEMWIETRETEDSHFQAIITENLAYIERQCRKAIEKTSRPGSTVIIDITIENESLELFNRVLDRLKENNFKILAQFQGKSKISTYLSAIIARQAVDMIRHKRGRPREKERASGMGPLGENIYQMVFRQGLSPAEARKELELRFDLIVSLEKVETLVAEIKGRSRLEEPLIAMNQGTIHPETGELIIADPSQGPEEAFMGEIRGEKLKRVVLSVLDRLKGEERLLLRMRFPPEGSEPMEVEKIARLLDISPKAVYNRLSRLLAKCRTLIVESGIEIDELF